MFTWSHVLKGCVQALKGETVGTEADLWALGCLIYQMFVGKPPFRGASEYLTFERISQHDLQVPKEMPPEAADLVQGLLKEDPKARLGTPWHRFQHLYTAPH